MGFVMGGGEREMTATRYAVIRHIERVRHHLAFEISETVLNELALWAHAANAILFFEDGTVRAPNGKALVDPETGEADEGAEVPSPAGALERKQRSDATLVALEIPVLASLPAIEDEIEVELRPAADVLGRCAALFACALRAESLADGQPPIPVSEVLQRVPLATDQLSPEERAFLDAEPPGRQTIVNMVWRYEALGALMWSIGLLPELPLPTALVDVPRVARIMLDLDPTQPVSLRPDAEILDSLDLTFRLHWAATNARVTNKPPPADLDGGVIQERHHALNWLIRFEGAAWDDVTTPT